MWNVKAGIPGIPILSLDALGILLCYATYEGFPQIPTLAYISMISIFLATQPNILKQKISQIGYDLYKEETILLGFTACEFCQRDSSSVTGLWLFPIQLIGISQKSKCCKIKDSNIWKPKHNPVESTNMMQSQLVDGNFKSFYF